MKKTSPAFAHEKLPRLHILKALAVVIMKGGGEKASPASMEKVKMACMSSLIEGEEESVRAAAAGCASALTIFMDSVAIRYPWHLARLSCSERAFVTVL